MADTLHDQFVEETEMSDLQPVRARDQEVAHEVEEPVEAVETGGLETNDVAQDAVEDVPAEAVEQAEQTQQKDVEEEAAASVSEDAQVTSNGTTTPSATPGGVKKVLKSGVFGGEWLTLFVQRGAVAMTRTTTHEQGSSHPC